MAGGYSAIQPEREELDALPGAVVLEFGNDWCGHCRRARPLVAAALAAHPRVRHLKFADARARRLGRSFLIKLWPTLVFLRDGKEAARVVRPADAGAIRAALAAIDPGG
jgi:thioredoxin 1